MTESVGVVIAALIAALTFSAGEVIRIRERRIDRIASRVAAVQEAVQRFTVEAAANPRRNKPVHLETAIRTTGSITALLGAVGKRDRRFVLRLLEAVGETPHLPLEQVTILLAIVSSQLDTWMMSPRAGRKQGHPLERLDLRAGHETPV